MRGFKAPTLRYQFRDGKGTATIVQGDGTRCKAETTAGLMSSGNTVINSRYTARCVNGTRYKMPQLVCKQEMAPPCVKRNLAMMSLTRCRSSVRVNKNAGAHH